MTTETDRYDTPTFVTPAKAGVQDRRKRAMDSRFRGNDIPPSVTPAKAGVQGRRKRAVDSRFRGNDGGEERE